MTTYAETYDYHYNNFQAMPSAAAAPRNESNPERHVLAERYKTKMCRNYLTHGECPYEVRCMFAHGDHELRTCEMNLRDGLITEEAIKAFQRSMNMRNRSMSQHAAAAAYHTVPDYVGVPPADFGPSRFAHNPYGYAVVRPATPEDFYPAPEYSMKVDPNAIMEP